MDKYFYNIHECLRLMNLVGAHPGKVGSKMQLLIFSGNIISAFSVWFLLYVWVVSKEDLGMADVVLALNFTFYWAHGTMMLANLYIKRPQVNFLINEMLTKFWDIDTVEDPKLKKEFEFNIKLLKYKSYLYIRLILADVLLFIYAESIKRGKLTRETFPVCMWYPPYVPDLISMLYVTVSACLIMVCDVINDTLMFTTVTLTVIQYRMLNNEMRNIFLKVKELDGCHTYSRRIRRCNEHLGFLLDFRNITNRTYSTLLLLYVGCNVVSLCFSMYLISAKESTIEDSLRAFGSASGLFFQFMFCYCTPIQDLVNSSEETQLELYSSEWYMHPEHCKDIFLLLGKASQRVYVSAGGIMDLDHETGLAALKSVLSYYGVLRTVGAAH